MILPALQDLSIEQIRAMRNIDGCNLKSAEQLQRIIFSDLEMAYEGRPLNYTFNDVTSTCTDIPELMRKLGWLEYDPTWVRLTDSKKDFVITKAGRKLYKQMRVPESWMAP